jgi:CRP-like cAMP-binding protein
MTQKKIMVDANKIDLSKIEIFSELKPQQIAQISATCQQNYYQRGDQIIGQLSDTQEVYFIARGLVRVINLTKSGKEVALEVLKQGKSFGELAAIDGGLRSSSVIAMEPSLLITMSAKDFLLTLQKYPAIGLKVMVMLASVIRTSGDRITDLVTLGANARVLAELMKKIQETGINNNKVSIENFPVHNEIARRASTTRETVTRVLSTLSKKEVIKRRGTTLEILDVTVLERTFSNLSDSDI